MKRLGILASGSGTNMEAIVRACRGGLLADRATVAVLISNQEKAVALKRARRLGVPARTSLHRDYASRQQHEAQLLKLLRTFDVDLVVLAGYMRILTPFFLDEATCPVVNIHPVPTHLYQGPRGYEHAWEHRNQSPTIFATVHLVDAGVDTGTVIIYGLSLDLSQVRSLNELRTQGLCEEHRLYPEAIHLLLASGGPSKSNESPIRQDLLAAADAAQSGDGNIRCEARRKDSATVYRIEVVGRNTQSLASRSGSLELPERPAFTALVLELLHLAREIPTEFFYDGLPISLRDTRGKGV